MVIQIGPEEELEQIEVELPRELLDDIDDYVVDEGFGSPSDLVEAALGQ